MLGAARDGLREAVLGTWARYGLPVAMTEIHIGGEAAQRRAWWWAAVRTANALIADGVDVRAVTAWPVFGSWEWPSLLTEVQGHYEPGLFDTRRRPPRGMALAGDVAAAASGLRLRAPVAGWWTQPGRIAYSPVDADGRDIAATADAAGPSHTSRRPARTRPHARARTSNAPASRVSGRRGRAARTSVRGGSTHWAAAGRPPE